MTSGVYISWPFCAQKCTYCNFASGVFPRELEERYLTAICAEISGHDWTQTPDTVYLGGGTPSQLDARDLGRILAAIPATPWVEATIEAAPGTITETKAAGWLAAGINRVSLGVQSFDQRELARTGRRHTADIVEGETAILRAAGIANINIDLIAGLPGQTPDSWKASLEWVRKLDVPHVSVYMLEVDEDSRLGREVLFNGQHYGAREVPPDERIAEFYENAAHYLREIGIERYEISNFARPGFESLHNLKYWRLEPYAGFGADAHSFDGEMRYQNVEQAAEYVERVEAGESPRLSSEPANALEEKFFVGLRLTAGVHPDPFEWAKWEAPISRFLAEGLLERRGDSLRLTEQGVLFSNEVFAEFLLA